MVLPRTSRLAVGIFAAAALTGSGGIALATASAADASHPVPACAGGDLRIAASGGEGAAGTQYYSLVFKNETRRACSLYGHPGLDAVTAHGHVLAHAQREPNPGHRAHTVVLQPGGHATAVVSAVDMGRDGRECALAHHIATTPPNTYRTVLRTRPTYLCNLSVRPVVPGSGAAALP